MDAIVMDGWKTSGGLYWRSFENEGAYYALQRTKTAGLTAAALAEQDKALYEALVSRISYYPGRSVLCLGARTGAEVRAFRDRGAFAVGIDLVTGDQNVYVHCGDMRNIPYPDGCADVVYTNSLDHAYKASGVLKEIRCVLKPGGVFILEAQQGLSGGQEPGAFEVFYWRSIDDLFGMMLAGTWQMLSRTPFNKPWPGEQLILRPL